MKRWMLAIALLALAVGMVVAQEDPWWRPMNPFGQSAGVGYGLTRPSVAATGTNPANGELFVDMNSSPTLGPQLIVWSDTDTAWMTMGSQLGAGDTIVFEGTTADQFETTLTVVDPTADVTITLPNDTGTVLTSTLATNEQDVINSIWGGTNQLIFEGGAADAGEFYLTWTNSNTDVTLTVPADNADWAGTGSPMISTLLTNAPEIVNSVTGGTNQLIFEGTANAIELILSAEDGTAGDQAFELPDNAAPATYNLMFSVLDTNRLDVANSVWGESNALAFEGTTANTEEARLSAENVTADVIYEMGDEVAGTYKLLSTGGNDVLGGAGATEISPNDFSHVIGSREQTKIWFRQGPVFTSVAPTAGAGYAACDPNGALNYVSSPIMPYVIEMDSKGNNAACAPTFQVGSGARLTTDAANNEGFEWTFGITAASPGAYVIGTDPAFYGRIRLDQAVVAESDQVYFGFRLVQAYDDAVIGNYTDLCGIGYGDLAQGANYEIRTITNLNGAGIAATDVSATNGNWGNAETHTLEVRVSAGGVCTTYEDGVLAAAQPAHTFDATDTIIPFLWVLNDDAAAAQQLDVAYIEFGIQ